MVWKYYNEILHLWLISISILIKGMSMVQVWVNVAQRQGSCYMLLYEEKKNLFLCHNVCFFSKAWNPVVINAYRIIIFVYFFPFLS